MSGFSEPISHQTEDRLKQKRYESYLQKIKGHTSTFNASSVTMQSSRYGPPLDNMCNSVMIPAQHNVQYTTDLGNTNMTVHSFARPPTEPIFKMPQTVKSFNMWSHLEFQANLTVRSLRHLNNKKYFKLWLRCSLEFLKYVEEHVNAPMDPEAALQHITRVVISTWYDSYTPNSNTDVTSLSSFNTHENVRPSYQMADQDRSCYNQISRENQQNDENVTCQMADQDRYRYNQISRGNLQNDENVRPSYQMADQDRSCYNQISRENQQNDENVTCQMADQDRCRYNQISRGNLQNDENVTRQMANQDSSRYNQISRENLQNTSYKQTLTEEEKERNINQLMADIPWLSTILSNAEVTVQDTKDDSMVSVPQQKPSRRSSGQDSTHRATLQQEDNQEWNMSSLFSDTLRPQKRDKMAAQQACEDIPLRIKSSKDSRKPAQKVNAAKVSKTASNNSNKNQVAPSTPFHASLEKKSNINTNNVNDSKAEPICARAVSRTGRIIKSPIQFWKGNEKRVKDTFSQKLATPPEQKVNLNDSMVLRSNKIIDKNIKVGASESSKRVSASDNVVKKNTPLRTIHENEARDKPARKPKARKNFKEDKENMATENQVTKKKNAKKSRKSNEAKASSKESKQLKENKTEIQKQVKKTSTTSHSQKRKSKEIDDTANKKKKVEEEKEETSMLDYMSDDDLFSAVTFRRSAKPAIQAIPPSEGLLSVKKSVSMSKIQETPLAKTLPVLLDMDECLPQSAASSVAKDAPTSKMNQVMKRVAKVAKKKDLSNMFPKADSKSSEREAPSPQQLVDEVAKSSTCTTQTHLGQAMSVGTAYPSGYDSDISEDDDIF